MPDNQPPLLHTFCHNSAKCSRTESFPASQVCPDCGEPSKGGSFIASPVTRSGLVDSLIKSLPHHLPQHGWEVVNYIAQLEASQPKPQGEVNIIIGHATLDKMRAEGVVTHGNVNLFADDRLFAEGPKPQNENDALAFATEEYLKGRADGFKEASLKPQSDEGLREVLEWVQTYMRDDMALPDKVCKMVEAALSRQAPVPTSGAVEVAEQVCGCIDWKAFGGKGVKFDTTKAAAIIQQYGDWRCAEYENVLTYREKLGVETPPAADGKLREALEANRKKFIQIQRHDASKFMRNPNFQNAFETNGEHPFLGHAKAPGQKWLTPAEVAEDGIREVDAALSQPASGGGDV